MDEFKGVTVLKKANVYFDGKVTSRTVLFEDGSKKTLGVMLPGEYKFKTDAGELMEIMSGDLEVLIAEETSWKKIEAGQSFEVPASSHFRVKVRTLSDYCCSFLS
jgi:uncharacterized protein YaiE (UPF0345 family)